MVYKYLNPGNPHSSMPVAYRAELRAPSAPASSRRDRGPASRSWTQVGWVSWDTTQLVALTGQRLGSVGGHLKVLRDANLLERRRAGKSVLYYRSPAGDALVQAQNVAARPESETGSDDNAGGGGRPQSSIRKHSQPERIRLTSSGPATASRSPRGLPEKSRPRRELPWPSGQRSR